MLEALYRKLDSIAVTCRKIEAQHRRNGVRLP
jgi:hypothetical protein